MIKEFCDSCEVELNDRNSVPSNGIESELVGNGNTVRIKLNMYDAIPIDFHVCKYCLLDAINKLDDRPAQR